MPRKKASRARARRRTRPAKKSGQSFRITNDRQSVPEGAERAREFTIVGVGGSAGGFEAFAQMLHTIPDHANLALIFVQHLAPHHGSALSTLLAGYTPFHVVEATEGVRVAPRNVYVVPPNVQMELEDGHLHLGPRPADKSQYTPIDVFFRSLARTLQQYAIGVVLSGTASDGAHGLRDIKTMGGITIVQDPATAKYDGMPRASIATQAVDLVLTPHDIGTMLMQIAENPMLRAEPEPTSPAVRQASTVTEAHLERVFKVLLPATGIDFMHYKTPTIMRRLLRRMTLARLPDVNSYIAYLEEHPDEAVRLHNDLLIHVTRFFREPESFGALARDFISKLDVRPDAPIRAWVAGCATGEEAYSLAIVLYETLGDRLHDARIQIFGTDASEAAVEYARHGVYAASISADVSGDRLRRFFTKENGSYKVAKGLRDMCVFARHDLTRDPPFSRLDIICCRNVLIYMDARLQRKLLSMFHYALKPTGVLLLGHAETIGYNSELFTLMDKKHRIFRKKADAPASADIGVTLPSFRIGDGTARPTALPSQDIRGVVHEVNRIMLDRFAPASVLVDQNLHVVQFNGQTGRFLEPSPGEPSFHVLKLAREGLLHGLRTALQTARKTRRAVRREGLRVRIGSTWVDTTVEVVPIVQRSQTFYLVLFEENGKKPRGQPTRVARPEPGQTKPAKADRHVARLEEELAATREYLQSTIQEIEAANEELQSANEEVLSSNEELQSTNEELDTAKEELQSTNEELNTVNDELHGRNEELTRVNADLLNLLSSVQIAIVIVSRDLRIRRFTPMGEKMFNLIGSDVGRPFSQIRPNISCANLLELIQASIEKVEPIERDVLDKDGRKYVMRIRPYKTPDNRIEGAVIALFDFNSQIADAGKSRG